MDLNYNNDVIILFGGSDGIGKAVLQKLSNTNVKIIVCSRNSQKLMLLENEYKACRAEILTFVANANVQDEINHVIEHVVERFGTINILINCAGGEGIIKPILELTTDDWLYDLNQNFLSAVKVCQAVIPSMKNASNGRIINVSSIAGKIPSCQYASYSVAKSALIAYTKALAEELAKFNILANVILPGIVDTKQMQYVENTCAAIEKLTPEMIKKHFVENIPLKRYASAEEIANVILFLGSKFASYISGSQFVIDGGLMHHI